MRAFLSEYPKPSGEYVLRVNHLTDRATGRTSGLPDAHPFGVRAGKGTQGERSSQLLRHGREGGAAAVPRQHGVPASGRPQLGGFPPSSSAVHASCEGARRSHSRWGPEDRCGAEGGRRRSVFYVRPL